ncbi:MAG TPA: class I adenylate-forming enzyme family protein [Rhizomicrobium sp.]
MTGPLPRISDYLALHARERPDATAAVLGAARMSYAQMHAKTTMLARALLAAGVRKGDRVAALQTPHPDFLVSFLAAASIGAIWVGLNPRHRGEELKQVVTDAEPAVLLTRTVIDGRSYADEIAALRAACAALKTVVAFDGEPAAPGVEAMSGFLDAGRYASDAQLAAANEGCGERDPCLIVYTSGSTGAPKGALLHHAGIVGFSEAQIRLWPVDPYIAVNYFPINHIGSVIDCSTPCLVAGGTLVFQEQFDPAACLALMERERVTLWGSVPAVFQMQTQLPDFGRCDLSAVQLIVWEGAALPLETLARLKAVCPHLATNYGMTETTSAITATAPTDDLDILANTVGEVFPGVEIRLAGPDGGEGEVQVRSAHNLLGYWRQDQATRDAFTADGFFKTGDLAVRRADGRYRLVGRLKEMYKSGGYNVYPREIELALESHRAVAEAAVVGIADPLWDEVGVAFVVTRGAADAAEIEAHCRARLANYKIPKRFVFVEALPLLPIGKVDKRALKTLAEAAP